MASFEDILKRAASSIKPPPAFPAGKYHAIIDGLPEYGKSSQKGTPYARFKYKIMATGEGVDADEAREMQVVGKTVTEDYYLTDAALYRLRDMLEAAGIDPGGEEGTPEAKPLDQMIAESPNRQLIIALKRDMAKDGKRQFHSVDRVEPVLAP